MKKVMMIVDEDKTTFLDVESGTSSDDGEVHMVKIKNLPLLFTEQALRQAFDAPKEEATDFEQWLLDYTNGNHV